MGGGHRGTRVVSTATRGQDHTAEGIWVVVLGLDHIIEIGAV